MHSEIRAIRKWVGDDAYVSGGSAPEPNAHKTEPKIKKLYGPNGKVLKTISDRPPVGFHQGSRDD